MGAVKIEIKKDHEWNNVCLNNIEAIEFLTKFRWKFDDNYICKNLYSNDITKSNGIPDFYEEITCLYADLDMYIKNANLNSIERFILKYIMMGFDFVEISKIVKKKLKQEYKSSHLKLMFKYTCKKIFEEYRYNYEYWLHTSSNKRIDENTTYKQCSKCKKSLQKSLKYFKKYERSTDKLDYICRKCSATSTVNWRRKKKYDIK